MKHNGDPFRAIAINERLKAITDELDGLTWAATEAECESREPGDHAHSHRLFTPKLQLQEAAILKALVARGLTPVALPKPEQGKAGVKAATWLEMRLLPQLFSSKRTFEKAWDSLRADKRVSDAE